MKSKRFAILGCLIVLLFIIHLSLKKMQDKKYFEIMRANKELVEKSYDGKDFTLKKTIINEGVTYSIFAEKNKIILKYSAIATKGLQYTTTTFSVMKDENGHFVWSCEKDLILTKTKCEENI